MQAYADNEDLFVIYITIWLSTMSSNCDDSRVVANNWAEALRHATDEGFYSDTMMCFLHDNKMALTSHADNGEHVGIVCSKCFKFYCPGSFSQHTEDCKDSLAPSMNKAKHRRIAPICGPILGGSLGSMVNSRARCQFGQHAVTISEHTCCTQVGALVQVERFEQCASQMAAPMSVL